MIHWRWCQFHQNHSPTSMPEIWNPWRKGYQLQSIQKIHEEIQTHLPQHALAKLNPLCLSQKEREIHYWTYKFKKKKTTTLITMLLPYINLLEICPSHMNSLQGIKWPGVQVYMHCTSWHIPWTNIPTTLHIYVPLHLHCNLHIDPTLLQTSIKSQ